MAHDDWAPCGCPSTLFRRELNPDFAPYPPDDLGRFWAEALAEAESVPLEYRRSPTTENFPVQHRIELISFRSVGGQTVQGWIAFPDGERRLPSFLWVPPYGRESLLPNVYSTRTGMTSMSFNLHGEGAFHQERYTPSRGYFADGADEPTTFIFRQLVQHVWIAARVLQAQSEADEDRIAAMGMSQGGGLSLWAGALSPRIRSIVADMPFLGAMRYALSRNAYRYPLKELVDFMERTPLGRERVLHTLSYFDTVNLATLCQKPTLVSSGEKDPAVRPETAQAIFDAIPAKRKHRIEYPGGHDWHPEMVDNNAEWLRQTLD